MSKYEDYAKQVAEEIIDLMEQNLAPWQKQWDAGSSSGYGGMPYNAISGRAYSGGNSMHLFAIGAMKGYDDTRWMTYDQADKAGLQVKKGERATKIAFWDFSKVKKGKDQGEGGEGEGKDEKYGPLVKWFNVFNGDQIEGMPPVVVREVKDVDWRHNECERLLAESQAKINHDGGNRAFYRPLSDSIHLPEKTSFHSPDSYYATALHELGHWTGHKDRLNRDLSGTFGTPSYAKEELRAEISSMMIGDRLGIGHDPTRHAAYVKSWIEALKNDPKEIMRAASDAEKICTHLGIEAYQREQIQVKERVKDQTQTVEPVAETPAEETKPTRTRTRTRTRTKAADKAPEPVAATEAWVPSAAQGEAFAKSMEGQAQSNDQRQGVQKHTCTKERVMSM